MLKILVLTVSDRAYKKVYDDLSGPTIKKILQKKLKPVSVTQKIVPDVKTHIALALKNNLDKDVIITAGGTGIGPRDVTPEVTQKFCTRLIPGIAEWLRAKSLTQSPNAVLSCGVAGIKGKTIIINLPGSVRAVKFCTKLLIPILPHAKKMLQGAGHE